MPCGHPIINEKLTRPFFYLLGTSRNSLQDYGYKYFVKIDINTDIDTDIDTDRDTDMDTVSGSSLFRVELPDRPFLSINRWFSVKIPFPYNPYKKSATAQ